MGMRPKKEFGSTSCSTSSFAIARLNSHFQLHFPVFRAQCLLYTLHLHSPDLRASTPNPLKPSASDLASDPLVSRLSVAPSSLFFGLFVQRLTLVLATCVRQPVFLTPFPRPLQFLSHVDPMDLSFPLRVRPIKHTLPPLQLLP
jgi:hypothetical protein